jgi:UDP-N-acetylmuramoyl-tripeptide--D-alanyl-D-alanine ligase
MNELPLWTSDEAERATGGTSSRPWRASGISIDSRGIAPGDLFVALKGPCYDGHDFAVQALAAGAAAVIANRPIRNLPENAAILRVEDSRAALTALARAARERSRASILAVTGSVGKTGVKEALKFVLSLQGSTSGTRGNLNNELGLPLSLARLPRNATYGVFELAMNHAGEIDRLSRLTRPHVAIITTVAAGHLEHFDSMMAMAGAKAEIFHGMTGGTAILNRDNVYFPLLADEATRSGIERIVGFGAHVDAEAQIIDFTMDADGSRVQARILGRPVTYRLPLPGQHWVMNSLAVLAAVEALGADVESAAAALAGLPHLEGRGRRHRVALDSGSFELIDESYNANPASMRAAFAALAMMRPGRGGRRIAVLGDMRELGADSRKLHLALAPALIECGIDLVFTAGEQMAQLHHALPEAMRGGHAENAEDLCLLVIDTVRPGDVVTVKGSLASRMGGVAAALLELGATPSRVVNGS